MIDKFRNGLRGDEDEDDSTEFRLSWGCPLFAGR